MTIERLRNYDRLNIRIFVDPVGDCLIEVDTGGESKIALEEWVSVNCKSATWTPAQGYSWAILHVEDEEEREAFLEKYSEHAKAYDNIIYMMHEGKLALTTISLDDLREKYDAPGMLARYRKECGLEESAQTENRADVLKFLAEYNAAPVGAEIYWFNNMRALSGSAGFCIVKDRYLFGALGIWRS